MLAMHGLYVVDPRSSSVDRPRSCQSWGHSEQMLAQPAGHGDLESISKGSSLAASAPNSPPWQWRPSAAGYKRAIYVCVRVCARERLQTSIVCHSSFSEKVPVNQSHALCNTALNEIQWTDWVSDGWFTYIQPELSDGETLARRVEEVRVG